MKQLGIYIHVPFCHSKCIYCDFFSANVSLADWELFADSVLGELRMRADEIVSIPDTLYIGGGTPSIMPAECFRHLIEGITEITGKTGAWREFTIEINPEDVTDGKCRKWRECGANRASMGIQSFCDDELKAIKRRHDSEQAVKAYNTLREYFDNVSIDLMFGLPGQTLESWKYSVKKALELNPEHISAYTLMFEDGTPITVLKNLGRLSFTSDAETVEMWKYLSEMLQAEGYRQYEISNYSKPGMESVHNRRYWLGNPYIGLGPSAHSYDGNRIRRSNHIDLKGYVSFFTSGIRDAGEAEASIYEEERLTDEELAEEYIMLRMRMAEGIDTEDYRERFGSKALGQLIKNAQRQSELGKIAVEEGRMRLTKDGIMTADEVIIRLSI